MEKLVWPQIKQLLLFVAEQGQLDREAGTWGAAEG